MRTSDEHRNIPSNGDPESGISELETALLLAPLSEMPSVRTHRGIPRRKPRAGIIATAGVMAVFGVGIGAMIFKAAHSAVKPAPALANVVDRATEALTVKSGSIVHYRFDFTGTAKGKTFNAVEEVWLYPKLGNRTRLQIQGQTVEIDSEGVYDGKRIYYPAEKHRFSMRIKMDDNALGRALKPEIEALKSGGAEMAEQKLDGRKVYRITKKVKGEFGTFFIDAETFDVLQIISEKGNTKVIVNIKVQYLPLTEENKTLLKLSPTHPEIKSTIIDDEKLFRAVKRVNRFQREFERVTNPE